MASSVTLLEREGRSTALDYTSTLVCAKLKDGTFSLQLVEYSDIAKLRHPIAKHISTPREFIDAVLSIMGWTDLQLDYDIIVDEMSAPLRDLDPEFSSAVVNQVIADRTGVPTRGKALRA